MKNLRNIIAAIAVAAGIWSASAQEPQYIFYFIGDGMGLAPLNAAEYYNRTIAGATEPLTMMQFDVASWAQTYSASSDITDSAAAGTALSTGHKTRNGMLGQDADSVDVTSIAVKLRDMGYGIGIATSVAPDDATPGAFYAHVPNRHMAYEIDKQMAASGYLFMAGGGLRGTFTDGKPNDVYDTFAAEGVQIVRGPEGIATINSERVLLTGAEGTPEWNIGYTIDSIAGRLTLNQITDACMAHLEKYSPDRFFMMIEGGNIDHALHANDGGAAIKEIINFDKCIAKAFEFYKEHPEQTLIVVTADHDTGGMAMIKPAGAKGGLRNIDRQRVSKEEFSNYCKGILKSKRAYTWADMKEYLEENFGFFTHIKLKKEQKEHLQEVFEEIFEEGRNKGDQETLYAKFNAFAVEVFAIFNQATGLAFTTTSHSANPVPVFATGVGADAFRTVNNNIDIPAKILQAIKK